jgi:hypothetical protein
LEGGDAVFDACIECGLEGGLESVPIGENVLWRDVFGCGGGIEEGCEFIDAEAVDFVIDECDASGDEFFVESVVIAVEDHESCVSDGGGVWECILWDGADGDAA